ncbi:MAG: hypothetical protein AAF266_16525, partial [Planctomycetota bacterium]
MSASIINTVGLPPDPCTRAFWSWKDGCVDFFDDALKGAYATTYYVSDAIGNDSNDGLSVENPFRTYEKGLAMLAASGGDTQVLFQKGNTFRQFHEQAISDCDRIRLGWYGVGHMPMLTAFELEYPAASGWTTSNTSNDWRTYWRTETTEARRSRLAGICAQRKVGLATPDQFQIDLGQD